MQQLPDRDVIDRVRLRIDDDLFMIDEIQKIMKSAKSDTARNNPSTNR
jgi:hypothetical protein